MGKKKAKVAPKTPAKNDRIPQWQKNNATSPEEAKANVGARNRASPLRDGDRLVDKDTRDASNLDWETNPRKSNTPLSRGMKQTVATVKTNIGIAYDKFVANQLDAGTFLRSSLKTTSQLTGWVPSCRWKGVYSVILC